MDFSNEWCNYLQLLDEGGNKKVFVCKILKYFDSLKLKKFNKKLFTEAIKLWYYISNKKIHIFFTNNNIQGNTAVFLQLLQKKCYGIYGIPDKNFFISEKYSIIPYNLLEQIVIHFNYMFKLRFFVLDNYYKHYHQVKSWKKIYIGKTDMENFINIEPENFLEESYDNRFKNIIVTQNGKWLRGNLVNYNVVTETQGLIFNKYDPEKIRDCIFWKIPFKCSEKLGDLNVEFDNKYYIYGIEEIEKFHQNSKIHLLSILFMEKGNEVSFFKGRCITLDNKGICYEFDKYNELERRNLAFGKRYKIIEGLEVNKIINVEQFNKISFDNEWKEVEFEWESDKVYIDYGKLAIADRNIISFCPGKKYSNDVVYLEKKDFNRDLINVLIKAGVKEIVTDNDDRELGMVRSIMGISVNGKKGRNVDWVNERILIIAPWCDVGLGIQAREYYWQFEKAGLVPYIYTYKSYNVDTTYEWKTGFKVFDSKEFIECLDIFKLINYCIVNRIRKIVLLEGSGEGVYDKMGYLKELGFQVDLIPNVEMLKVRDLGNIKNFSRILCSNQISMDIFKEMGVETKYFGFNMINPVLKKYEKNREFDVHNVKFVFFGGRNAQGRKNVKVVSHIFRKLAHSFNNFQIEICLFNGGELEKQLKNIKYKHFKVNIGLLSYDDVIKKIVESDIVVHFGTQEGLGLGFYESVLCHTPIIALNHPPGNEVIGDRGWLIDCGLCDMYDNKDGIIYRAKINEDKIYKKIKELLIDMNEIYDKIEYCKEEFKGFNMKIEELFR